MYRFLAYLIFLPAFIIVLIIEHLKALKEFYTELWVRDLRQVTVNESINFLEELIRDIISKLWKVIKK